MMERTSGRRTHLRLALTLTVLWTSTACQDAKKDDVSAIAPTATPVPAPVAAPSEEASTPLAARPADEHNDVADAGPTDGGTDGGARQRRRPLVANAPEAGAAETTAPTTPAQVAEPTTGEGSHRKVATPMGNEQPYGTSAGSGAPVLKKKPLPDDDPWKKPQPPP